MHGVTRLPKHHLVPSHTAACSMLDIDDIDVRQQCCTLGAHVSHTSWLAAADRLGESPTTTAVPYHQFMKVVPPQR